VRWVADQLGHADPALTLRVYAHVIPNDEQDLCFLNFDGSERLYPAPTSARGREDENAISATARANSEISGVSDGDRTRDLQGHNLAL
jgi:hypothetical protein